MIKIRLDYDQINLIPMNLNIGTWPKVYTDEHFVDHLLIHFEINIPKLFVHNMSFLKWGLTIKTFWTEPLNMNEKINIFGHVHHVNVRRWEVFGQIHIFWSYSFFILIPSSEYSSWKKKHFSINFNSKPSRGGLEVDRSLHKRRDSASVGSNPVKVWCIDRFSSRKAMFQI